MSAVRYVVVGAGAIGGVIGARLHATGRDIVLVARGAHLDAIRQRGLLVRTPDGDETHHIEAVADPDGAGLRAGDVVLLAVKSQHTAGALEQLAACATPETPIVCAQNGVENERACLRHFRRVYGMCVIMPAVHLEAGVVCQHSAPTPGILDLGRYPHGVDDLAKRVAADLRASGFESRVEPDVMRNKYRKLVMNLQNALVALCGAEGRSSVLLRAATREAERCLTAAGIDLQSEAEEAARRASHLTPRPVDGHRSPGSSSWQSLARAEGSIEVDWLNGEIVLLGRLHGVPTPVNELLQREANDAARARRPPESSRLDELVAMLPPEALADVAQSPAAGTAP